MGLSAAAVLMAVDAGNSKTDVALVRADGALLALVRGPGFRPHSYGVDVALDAVEHLLGQARQRAGDPSIDRVHACLANVDLPVEEQQIEARIRGREWGRAVEVMNDTFAVLRTGTDQPRGVAVVCGAGINCVGLRPDGRSARFLALGQLTGDWGGGTWLAREVMWWSTRAEDGRGPETALAAAVAEHFGLAGPLAVAEQVHLGRISPERLHELVPVLLRVADEGDDVARSLVLRQADEVVSMAVTALRRLDLDAEPVDIVLGGGVLTTGNAILLAAISAGLTALAPLSQVRLLTAPPVLGAILFGLERMAADGLADPAMLAGASARIRCQLDAVGVSMAD